MSEFVFNPKIINERFRQLLNKKQRYQIVFGGSGSSKSYSIWTMAVMWMIEGRSILGIRNAHADVKKSIWREVTKAITRLDLEKHFKINKSVHTIECLVSHGCLVTAGVKDGAETLKSVSPILADSFDTLIIEEATEIESIEKFNNIFQRQRASHKFPTRAILLFNPVNKTHALYEMFFKEIEDEYDFNKGRECLYYEGENVLIHKSTYEDNPYTTEADLVQYERMRQNSPDQWQVFARGNFGVFGEKIFEHNILVVDRHEENLGNLPWRIGMDHGFNDFETLCISKYDPYNHKIYIVDTIQQRKMLPDQFAQLIKEKFKQYNISMGTPIMADSSHPGYNEIYVREGFNIVPAKKPQHSKFSGIMWLKTEQIIVPKYLNDFCDSVSVYTWKKDRRGIVTDETNHDGSDLMDAMRYSFENDSIYGSSDMVQGGQFKF